MEMMTPKTEQQEPNHGTAVSPQLDTSAEAKALLETPGFAEAVEAVLDNLCRRMHTPAEGV